MTSRGRSRMPLPAVAGAVLVVVVAAGAVYLLAPLVPVGPSDYQQTTVRLVDDGGETLATVDVRVADTRRKRYTGLSRTESLDAGEGMLFVHDRAATHTYVMRGMAFPLDIVFVDANGRVTAVRHAPVPSADAGGGDLTRYTGYGKYVLEVPMGYADRTGLDVGDRVLVPENVSASGPLAVEKKVSVRGTDAHKAAPSVDHRWTGTRDPPPIPSDGLRIASDGRRLPSLNVFGMYDREDI